MVVAVASRLNEEGILTEAATRTAEEEVATLIAADLAVGVVVAAAIKDKAAISSNHSSHFSKLEAISSPSNRLLAATRAEANRAAISSSSRLRITSSSTSSSSSTSNSRSKEPSSPSGIPRLWAIRAASMSRTSPRLLGRRSKAMCPFRQWIRSHLAGTFFFSHSKTEREEEEGKSFPSPLLFQSFVGLTCFV